MMLLGRYSRLVLDSWTRPKYASLNGGRPVKDATIERRFRRYGPYAGPRVLALPHPRLGPGRVTQARYRDGARRIAPIALAALAFSVSFGVLARASGIGSVEAIVMSATVFAGSAQFAIVSILGVGGAVASAILAAVLLNARYAPISVSLAPVFVGGRLRRLLEAQLIVDESWAMSRRADGALRPRGCSSAPGSSSTSAGSGAPSSGALAGDALGDPADLGLDAAFPALFLALLVPQVRSRRALAAAVLGGTIALALIPDRPAGVPIVAAAVGLPDRLEAAVSDVWLVTGVVAAATIAFKAVGPVLLGGKPLPEHLTGMVELLAPALLAALVVTQVVGGDEEIVLDARLVGLGAAVVALLLRAPLLVVVVAAAAATALMRLVS